MTSNRLNKAIRTIKAETEKIWFDEPADIGRITQRLGARHQSLTTVIFAYQEVTAICRYLYGFRRSALAGELDLDTLIKITIDLLTDAAGGLGDEFYHAYDTEKIIKMAIEVLPDATDMNEYCRLIEKLLIYTRRFETWVNRAIPWHKLQDVFMASLEV